MKKISYLALSILVSSVLYSCSSKKMNIKNGVTVVHSNSEAGDSSTANSDNVTKTDRGIMMTIDSDVLFPTNSSYLSDNAKSALDKFVALVKNHSQAYIQVDGHTDATGTVEYNQWLSEKRANSVKVYLQEAGISSNRIDTKGVGQTQPIGDNKTKEGRKKNRRVEITILD